MNRRRRALYLILGIICMAVGIIGIPLPIIPTTFPLILASGFLIHSSPKLHGWLNGNSLTGPYIRAYTEKRGLSRRRKISTTVSLWLGLGISAWFMRERIWVLMLLLIIGISVSIHIITIRSETLDNGQHRAAGKTQV